MSQPPRESPPRVLIAADAASMRFGGEAVLPLHYFRALRARGVEAWLVVHDRTRDELLELFPREAHRIHFVADTALHRVLVGFGRFLPHRVDYALFGFLSRLLTQRAQKPLIRRLVRELSIDIVHQPTPVSPREPSLLHDLGAPVVIGPLNGNMRYPPGFRPAGGWVEAIVSNVARKIANAFNALLPGKRRCATLLVANDRTREGLPASPARVERLVENGVDVNLFTPSPACGRGSGRGRVTSAVNFIYVGRLIDWKAVDLLIEAFARAFPHSDERLNVVGEGPQRAALQSRARALGVSDRVTFHGFQPQARCARLLSESDIFTLASLYECGGAAVLEAMAAGLPVIATDWGGPADYVDETCGVLVPPTSREAFVASFTDTMRSLATDAPRRQRLGEAGRQKVRAQFDWQSKIDRILEVYSRVAS